MSLEDLNISLLCLHVFARMFNEQRKLFYFFASYCMMGQLLCCCHLLSQLYKSILVSEKVAFLGGEVCAAVLVGVVLPALQVIVVLASGLRRCCKVEPNCWDLLY